MLSRRQLSREFPTDYPAAARMGAAAGAGARRHGRQSANGIICAVRRGRLRATDRLRKSGEFAAGAIDRTPKRDRDSIGTWSGSRAIDEAVANGKHFAGGDFRRSGTAGGGMAEGLVPEACSRGTAAIERGERGRWSAAVCILHCDSDGSDFWSGAGAADSASQPSGQSERRKPRFWVEQAPDEGFAGSGGVGNRAFVGVADRGGTPATELLASGGREARFRSASCGYGQNVAGAPE